MSTTTAPPVHHLEQVMGTVVTFDLYDDPPGPARSAVALSRARSLLRRYDAVFSLWKPSSPMSRLRRGELDPAEAPPEIAEVLALCDAAQVATDGWFDARRMPGGVDPTGLVKGWAAQRALEMLVASGYGSCLVNAGGDIATSLAPGAAPWRIGIRHPQSRRHLLAVVEVDGAIATSAEYERGPHLYDPVQGRFGSRLASATVTGPDLALADAMATALAVAGIDGLAFVGSAAGYEGLADAAGGRLVATSGMRIADLPAGARLETY